MRPSRQAPAVCDDDGPTITGPRMSNRETIIGFGVRDSGFRIQDSGFRIQGSGFRVQGSGFRV
jgi:hypothetical protein